MTDLKQAEHAFYQQIGESIRVAREQANATQQDIANIIGVPLTQYIKYEKGDDAISIFQMYMIINAIQPELIQNDTWPKI